MTLPDCLEHNPGGPVDSAIVWLHGLGASGYDFAPLVPHLGLERTRFVFPHAPERRVTINGGMSMPAWYDILTLERGPDRESAEDILASHRQIEALLQRERNRGVPEGRIVLAGFSQGAAMTLYSGVRTRHRLAGLLVLSGYLVLEETLAAEEVGVNARASLLGMHGTEDAVVPIGLGEHAFQRVAPGRRASWKTYRMGHEVCGEQVRAIRTWLTDLLELRDSPRR